MRLLNIKEILKLSQICDEIKLKDEIENIMSKKLDIILSNNSLSKEEKGTIVFLEVLSFLITNIYKAEDSIFELLSFYTGKDIKEVEKMDADVVIETIKNMFTNGLPKVIKKMIKLDDLKKKITELTETGS